MRCTVLQPAYPASTTPAAASDCQRWMIARLQELAPGHGGIVVLPEYANAPGLDGDAAVLFAFADAHGKAFLEEVARQASRLDCLICLGAIRFRDGVWRNQAVVFGPEGAEIACYDKMQLSESESAGLGLVAGNAPVTFTWRGVRIGLAICFDIYFPELFAALSACTPDLILFPSYQRSEEGDRIALLCRTRAFDTGALLARSSYAMPRPERGGRSLIADPAGRILEDLGATAGTCSVGIDPHGTFTRPAAHGLAEVEHRALTERNRRPAATRDRAERQRILANRRLPLLCAHRGLSEACPENTLPAFAAALAAGADEIEFDLWLSADGVPVVCHDPDLARTTDGSGRVMDLPWSDIHRCDAGVRKGEAWRGTPVPRFEEVADLMDGRIGMNIHIKDPGPGGSLIGIVATYLRHHGLAASAYLAGDEDVLDAARRLAPEIPRACLASQDRPDRQLAIAQRYACRRIQFFRSVEDGHLEEAGRLGLMRNLFYADDPEDAARYVARGIDVVLTNRAHQLRAGFPTFQSRGPS